MSKRARRAKTIVPVKFVETPTVSKENPTKLRLVTDTSCQGLGRMTWEGVYNLLEKENPKVTVEKASVPTLRLLKNHLQIHFYIELQPEQASCLIMM